MDKDLALGGVVEVLAMREDVVIVGKTKAAVARKDRSVTVMVRLVKFLLVPHFSMLLEKPLLPS